MDGCDCRQTRSQCCAPTSPDRPPHAVTSRVVWRRYSAFDSALRASSYNMFCSPLKPVNAPSAFQASKVHMPPSLPPGPGRRKCSMTRGLLPLRACVRAGVPTPRPLTREAGCQAKTDKEKKGAGAGASAEGDAWADGVKFDAAVPDEDPAQALAQAPPPPLPVLTGHVSSLLPY
jgi:hypothetical protein